MRTARFELYGTRLFRLKRHNPLRTRRSTAEKTEMPEMMLQHRDFFDDPAVAALTILRECLAADEDPLDSFFLYFRVRH